MVRVILTILLVGIRVYRCAKDSGFHAMRSAAYQKSCGEYLPFLLMKMRVYRNERTLAVKLTAVGRTSRLIASLIRYSCQ